MIEDLRELLDLIAHIDRDEDGDAMLDAEGLDRLKQKADTVANWLDDD